MNNELITILFTIVKKAEPPILLTGISLAIGALVSSQEAYLQIFNYSIISSFMFIFSFIFYVIYEIYKEFIINQNKQPDTRAKILNDTSQYDTYNSNVIFVKNCFQIGSIFYFFMGILFFILIAYEFGNSQLNLTELKVESYANQVIPILPIVKLFFIIYYPGCISFYFIKNLKQKNVNLWNIIGTIIVLSCFIPVILNQIFEIMGKTPLIESSIMSILFLPFAIIGLVIFSKTFNSISKKFKIIAIVLLIIFTYGILNFALYSILNFDLEKYIINSTSDGFNKLYEKILANSEHKLF